MTGAQADADVAYLFRHQLDEADIVCFTKADAGVAPPALDGVAGHAISAKTGAGRRRLARPRPRAERVGRVRR